LSFPPIIVQVLVLLIVIPAAMFDLRQRRVPNWITLPAILLGIALNGILDFRDANLRNSLLGLGLAFLIYFPLYLLRAMGAGDVKLMAAVGAIMGWANWLGIFVLTAVIGGLAAIVAVAARGRLRKTFYNIWFILLSLLHRQAPYESNPELDVRNVQSVRLPHAVVIALGAIGFLVVAAIWAPR
jgi:prepilin peptidase CpaA